MEARIPPGVAHDYKVLSVPGALLIYADNHLYDPADEGRIAYSDEGIKYNWNYDFK